MILTPIDRDRLPAALSLFAAGLADGPARALFGRIARLDHAERATAAAAAVHHREALGIITRFGMGVRAGSPAEGFSWDGVAVRSGTEAYVLLHEVAHFQLAAPERRHCVDFGLGPGPETGDRPAAERAATLFGLAREQEEAMASLLGIVWEVELGHPALASFLDQNWLEGIGRPGTSAHFENILARLCEGGFVTPQGHPAIHLRGASTAWNSLQHDPTREGRIM